MPVGKKGKTDRTVFASRSLAEAAEFGASEPDHRARKRVEREGDGGSNLAGDHG